MGDNSLFIHLRTGMDLVRTGTIPRADPYSFTAAGAPWVVQSWLASASYGLAERVGGFPLVRIQQGLLYAALAWCIAHLARTGTPWRTALGTTLTVGLGVVYWSPRPLAIGLVALALTVVIVEGRRPWWLLPPLVWVWVNSHGSFVLGLAWLVLVALGQRVAGERRPPVLPWIGGFVAGLAAACINPLGPRLLTFPLAVLSKREAFAEVAEWRPPSLLSASPPAVVTALSLAGVAVVLLRRRPPWPDALPVAAFVAAGLLAQRNLPMAAVVAAPAVGRVLTPRRTGTGPVEPPRPMLHSGVAAALSMLAIVFVAVAAGSPAFDLRGYPVRAARLYDRPTRVATTDVAAGYLILREGARARVLFDDRVDLYPLDVTRDYLRLHHGAPGALDVLDARGAEVVLWERDQPLDALLAASGRWRRAGARDGWAVWVRVER